MDGPYSQGYDFDVWGNVTHKYGWGGEVQGGTAGQSSDIYYTHTGNRRNGFSYDLSGNLTNDLGQTFTYDATGQQATAAYGGYSLQQSYDGNGLRATKNDNGAITYYLRSSVLGGQVVAEMSGSGGLQRSYIYLGGGLLALKLANGYSYWVHEDPVTKSKRVTDMFGAIVSTIELDPWGADTNRSSNVAFQPKKFTSYERDVNGSDEAMFRRYNRWQSRFDQPDPSAESIALTNPQSFNRYAYVQGDPVSFTDPTGLFLFCPASQRSCFGDSFWSGFLSWGFGRPGSENAREEARHDSIINHGFDPEFPDRDAHSRAYVEMLRRLERPACAWLFGGTQNAQATLADTIIRIENLGTPYQDFRTGTIIPGEDAETRGLHVIINSSGTYFHGSQLSFPSMIPGLTFTVTVDTWKLQGANWGALVLLHELGHRAGIYGKNNDDANNKNANRANTQKVYDACFK